MPRCAVVLVGLFAASVVSGCSIHSSSKAMPAQAASNTFPCPVHAVGKRLVDTAGHTVYRYPGYHVGATDIKCNGSTIWVLFHGGVASSQEAYLGVRSGDGGRAWNRLLAEAYFGIKAPFTIDSYSGPWAIVGENRAYFVGWCPACGYGTVSLTVTQDGGRHFRRYAVRRLTGFLPKGLRVAGHGVTITATNQRRSGPRTRSVTIRVG